MASATFTGQNEPIRIEPIALDSQGNFLITNNVELRRHAKNCLAARVLPEHINTPERVEMLWDMCKALGLNPLITAKSTWISKKGALTLFGDAPLAACQKNPDFVSVNEWLVNDRHEKRTADNFVNFKPAGAVCVAKRRGREDVVEFFSMADARTAGLWGKPGPWTQYPGIMLRMRARSMALKAAFADTLQGVSIMEHDCPTTPVPMAGGRVVEYVPAADVRSSADELNAMFGDNDENA